VVWVVAITATGLVFNGYDLVVYGTVVPTFLRNPVEIGEVTPAVAGALGSYALIGVLVGALLAGGVGDVLGRRKVMLFSYAWFSIGMGVTALMTTTTSFGLLRFLTGLGVGALVATTGAIVSEFAPPGKKNVCNAIAYSGVPLGSLMAAFLAILLLESIGWRGMFWIGAIPIVTLLPLAFFKMPESVAWLAVRGRLEEALAISANTGVPIPPEASVAAGNARPASGRAGFAGLFSRGYIYPTLLLGLMSATSLLLVYSLNTWLPELMFRAGFNAKGSLSFLLVLNGGAVAGVLFASRLADRFGPKSVVATCFLIGAVAIAVLTLSLPLGVLLAVVAVVGLGTSGTQGVIYGFVANCYRTNVRAARVSWCAGFGRLGGVGGPLLGGFLIAAGLALNSIFYVLAALGVVGLALTLLVPVIRGPRELHRTPIEPTSAGCCRRTSDTMTRMTEAAMYDRILVAIDATPTEENASAFQRSEELGQLTGATVYVIHVSRDHTVPGDIITGASGLGVRSAASDAEAWDRAVLQYKVDRLAAAGIDAHGEMVSAIEHDIADIILQRANELDVDLVVLGHQHHRRARIVFPGSVAEQVIRHQPSCSILLAQPRSLGAWAQSRDR
jgi:AAHS family benzoate transporter-like MFS transporter